MGRHEIRLRRQRMTSRRIEGHKDYRALLDQHNKKSRRGRLLRSLIYVIIVLVLALLILFSLKKLYASHGEVPVQTHHTIISRPGIADQVQLNPQEDGNT